MKGHKQISWNFPKALVDDTGCEDESGYEDKHPEEFLAQAAAADQVSKTVDCRLVTIVCAMPLQRCGRAP